MAERYTTPEKDTLDWHAPLNENFNLLDTDVEIRDTEANLDSYSPELGAKFFATDTGRQFLGDGSTWTEAELSTPVSASDRTDPANGELWFNTNDGALRLQTPDGTVDIA